MFELIVGAPLLVLAFCVLVLFAMNSSLAATSQDYVQDSVAPTAGLEGGFGVVKVNETAASPDQAGLVRLGDLSWVRLRRER